MANPTTNYGWVMPTATDLVTDLPADFNTFGQGVDTSMAQLLGGTTGQILSKTSATSMAFTWIANDQGDITGVTAGVGISGGGTSGDVTVTNSMATAIDAKGDLIAGTGADAFSRLAIGTNNQVLTADSAQATGIKWATPTAAAFSGARGYKSAANQTITSGAGTNVTFQSESYDTASFHSTSTNTDRFTAPIAGYYLINCAIYWQSNATGDRILTIRKNAASTQMLKKYNGSYVNASGRTETVTGILYLAASDYVVAEAYWDGTGTIFIYTDELNTYFEITYLGA